MKCLTPPPCAYLVPLTISKFPLFCLLKCIVENMLLIYINLITYSINSAICFGWCDISASIKKTKLPVQIFKPSMYALPKPSLPGLRINFNFSFPKMPWVQFISYAQRFNNFSTCNFSATLAVPSGELSSTIITS